MTPEPRLDPELLRRLAALAGLTLSLERAGALAEGLRPILAGDARIAALGLGTLSPPCAAPDAPRD